MCRFAAYLGGPEVSLAALALEPEHSLLRQSYAPREMLSGVVNADGFGAGWYVPEIDGEPAVYTSVRPIWADRSFASLAPKVRSRHIFAALRNATPGLPAEESGVPPFARGPLLFMHNGAIQDFRRGPMRRLRRELSDEAYSELLGASDSETVFALVTDLARDAAAPDALAEALSEAVRRVARLCPGRAVALNLGLTDGAAMAFTRYSDPGPGNSLYVLEDGAAFPGSVVVASERLDSDPGWRPVPDRHMMVVDEKRGVSLCALHTEGSP
jgi:glutamine amidotransferase